MRWLALVERLDHVCCRYRLTPFVPTLRDAGHEIEIQPLPRDLLGWIYLGGLVANFEGVILQRRLLRSWQLYLLRRGAKRLLFDFDDAVFHRDSYSKRSIHSGRRVRRFQALARRANALIAGNDFLAQRAAEMTPDTLTTVVPTCLDVGEYPLAEHIRAGQGVQLVWVGSASTLQGLAHVRPMLEHLGSRLQGICLKLICDRFLKLEMLPVLPYVWSQATETAEIARADIGISWLPDDDWSRGKCGLKVLQYMAAGLPVVANPVGVQASLVRHGESGFLATTPEEWRTAIASLSQNPELRCKMGLAGRERVEKEFSTEIGARRWRELLDGLTSRRNVA